jgi:hypothetical protein
MAGVTNKGKYALLEIAFRNASVPTNYYIALITSAAAPTADTNTFADLTEVAAGNGYTAGGISLTKNSTDFDVLTEDDTNDRALIQLKDIVWTASGGTLPGSGSGARYAIITDDNGTQSARRVIAYFDLTSDRSVSSGQTLTLQNCEIRINES